MASNVLAKMAVLISAQTAEFNKAMQNSSAQLNKFQATANNVNKSLTTIGAGFGLFQVVGVIQSAIGTVTDFEAAMSEVKAITSATEDEFKALRDSALDLGKSTKFTAKEVAGLQLEYGRLGFTTKEILAASKATLSLATATGEDLAKSADVAGSTIRGFGLSATETQRVVDVMAESFNKSALGLENFSEAMKYVAPIAAQAGLTVEETTAMLGTLADAGIRGSQAGTSLRKIISDLGTESGNLSEKLAKLAAKGLTGADAMSEVGRTAYASLLVLADNTEKTNGLTKALNNSAGAAKKAADIMSDNLAGDLTKLSSAYDALVLSGGGFTKQLREITQAATNLVNIFSSPSESGVVKLLRTLIEYTPNLYNVARGINAITEAFSMSKEEQVAYLNRLGQLRDAAILRGDQKNVEMYTKSILDLTAKWGLIKDKPLEFSEGLKEQTASQDQLTDSVEKHAKTQSKIIPAVAGSIGFYQEQLRKLNDEYDRTTGSDLERLRILSSDIAFTERKIEQISRLKESFQELNSIQSRVPSPFPTGVSSPEAVLDRLKATMDSYIAKTTEFRDKVVELDLSGALTSSISSGITSVAEAMGQAAVGVGNFGQSILKAMANFARQMGEAMIAMGTAALAAKLLIKNPLAAIGAGVALVAIASALNASISGAQKNFNNSGGVTGGSGRTATANSSNFGTVGNSGQDSNPTLTTVVRGQDLWIMLENFERNTKQTKPVG